MKKLLFAGIFVFFLTTVLAQSKILLAPSLAPLTDNQNPQSFLTKAKILNQTYGFFDKAVHLKIDSLVLEWGANGQMTTHYYTDQNLRIYRSETFVTKPGTGKKSDNIKMFQFDNQGRISEYLNIHYTNTSSGIDTIKVRTNYGWGQQSVE